MPSHFANKLSASRGPDYWRSLDELAQTPEFLEHLHREFPAHASELTDEVSRRNFLKLMAASLALSGLTACTRQPIQKIVPYVKQPEILVPGTPLYFATAHQQDGFATGLIVRSNDGHPTKIEGNPDHPASLGATSVFDQAAILDLYDPDRSQAVVNAGNISSWGDFLSAVNALMAQQQPHHGSGLRILTETVTSPTLAAQMQALLKRFPAAAWHQFQPITRDNVRAGSHLAFGEFVETHHRFDLARVIVSLDSDFLFTHPMRLLNTRQFTDGRRVSSGKREMNRLYVAESTPTITGSMAEHRLAVRSGDIEDLARALARQVSANQGNPQGRGRQHNWLAAVAADLRQNHGASIVVAGERQAPTVHALAHELNHTLGNIGKTVSYTETAEAHPVDQLQSLHQLVDEMAAGKVEVLVVLGGNPVFNAPADFSFADHLTKVKTVIHLGLEADETSAFAHWHVPQTHFLEAWGDTRAFDGTVSIVQPLIQPLYENRSAHEVLQAFIQQPTASNYDIVCNHWQQQKHWPDFDTGWRRAIHDGFIQDTALKPKQVQLKKSDWELSPTSGRPSGLGELEITFHPDPALWDGRFANNGWLQELARPITKLVWDNAALISPLLAAKIKLVNGDMIQLQFQGKSIHIPVWITPGQAEDSVALHLGNGRSRVGHVGAGAGFNIYPLRTSGAFWFSPGLQVKPTGERYLLASTQLMHNMEGKGSLQDRDILFAANFAEFLKDPHFVDRQREEAGVEVPSREETLYDPGANLQKYDGYHWGMAIDLTTCIGCNACVTACQSENNIPVVGKEQVNKGRDMLWIRIDSYFRGQPENPQFTHAPIPCMHCEYAPCELVCPVAATVHDHEGLNLQVYNRCVGTRYCSNNCPYKVRRFNFLEYADYHTPSLKPMRNPDVTVRWRGVMEKCTYCIQRISAARITAEEQNRKIRDGEVVTACAQACPASAIIFGDLSDPNSRVSKIKNQPLNYNMLGTLNTRPRTTYLAKLRHPNPDLEKPA